MVHLLLYLFRNSRRQYFQNPEQPADSFTTKEQCRNIRALLQDAIQLFEHPPVNIPVLSVNCYQVLLQFSDVPDGQKLLSDPLYLRYVAPVIEEIETRYSLPSQWPS